MGLKATEVFTPGAFPAHTYVERGGEGLEQMLRDAIDTPGQVASLVGPSKSGKTVLVERVVGRDLLIPITGAGISSPDDIWNRVLDWMGIPAVHATGKTRSGTLGAGVSGSAGMSAFGLAKGQVEGSTEVGLELGRATSSTYSRGGLQQVVQEIAESEFVVLVDDFHYMPREVQSEAAKSLKEAVRRGVRVCTAAVSHRGDDLVRANPELRGRVKAVDLRYWAREDLQQIASVGFSELNAAVNGPCLDCFVAEAAGSPQLMQLLCLNACFVLGIRSAFGANSNCPVDANQLQTVLKQSSTSTDFRSLVDVLDAGPKTRGTERKLYQFKDGSRGDVYKAVLKAVASDPPSLSFSYEDLSLRTAGVCEGESPVGSSIVSTCLQISRLALERFPSERAIDWDEQKQILDIPDPYLLFYLRWSGRLMETD